MNLLNRAQRWLYKTQLQAALRMCQYTIKLHYQDAIPFIEFAKMAEQAELLLPKLQKELEELYND